MEEEICTTPSTLANLNTEDDFKGKNDGMHLIIEPGYSLVALREFMKTSCLSERCKFVETTNEIEEVFGGIFRNNIHMKRCVQ